MTVMRYLLLLFLGLLLARADEPVERSVMGKSGETSLKGKVVVINIGQDDLVNKQAFRYWRRTMERAMKDEARGVVLVLDTPGGLAFDTRDIIIDDFGKLTIPLIAWVEREALSAGALIAFSTDRIYMAPETTIGSAGLVNSMGQEIEKVMRAKLESAFEATMRAVVEKKGHRMDVLRAMMFVDEENERQFGSVTVRKGGLLNLTASEAIEMVDGEPLLAAGIAKNLDEVLRAEGLDGVEVIRPQPTGFEKFALWVAAFSPLLIAIGVGAGWIELKSPGFGLFGFISLGVFTLFFFGNNLAGNLAGYELMAVFMVGLALILLEIFVLPGMVAGIVGVLMVIGSLWFAMADRLEFDELGQGGEWLSSLAGMLIGPGLMLTLGLLGGVALMFVLMRYLPSVPLFRGLMAMEALASGPGGETGGPAAFVGAVGTALTDLRPTGTILVAGVKKDAISKDGLIPKGAEVKVLKEGMTFLVEAVGGEV